MKPRKSFLLRIEPRLYQELESWAAQELRSVNGQIEYVLRQAIIKHHNSKLAPDPVDPPEPAGGPNRP